MIDEADGDPTSRRAAPMTLDRALREARALGIDRLDAQLLLAHVVERPRSWLIAHDDATLSASQAEWFGAACKRRSAGEPLAYIVGEKEFHGLRLAVDHRVLVPRPDTEVLVDWAIELLAGAWPGVPAPRVVDLGTGSGAIALAVKHAWPTARMLATDLSDAALEVARGNAARLALDVAFLRRSWWAGLGELQFELVLSNPPYIAEGDAHLAALRHEPQHALTSGADGLNAVRAIIAGAVERLTPSGWLLLEHGFDQADVVQTLLRQAHFNAVETRRDLAGLARCTGGQRPIADSKRA